MFSLLLAAAEPSRTPFFIAGGIFAVYAVVLGVIGITQPEFPFGARGARAVMGISFLLMVLTIAMAVVTDP